MKTLKEIQQALQDSLTGKDQRIANMVVESKEMTAEDRLTVYYRDYYLRLLHALQDDYAGFYRRVGDERFDVMVRDYLDAYPPKSFTIREIGRDFPTFLKEKGVEPEWVELAEFEWTMMESLFSADLEVLTMETLSKIPPDDWSSMILHLHPSFRKRSDAYNTLELWKALDNKKQIESKLLDASVCNVIWRFENEIYFQSLTTEQAILIHAIAEGEIFSDLCEKMLDYFDEDAVVQWVAAALQTWVNEGIFSGYTIGGVVE